MDSSKKVFSIYKRVDHAFYKGNYEFAGAIYDPVQSWMYGRSPKFIKDQCFRIYNEIENSWYSYQDAVMVMIYDSIWASHLDLKKVNLDAVKQIRFMFTKKKLIEDQNAIVEINGTFKLPSIDDFFKIREKGGSFLHDLIEHRKVSLYFFINYYDRIKEITTGPHLHFDKCDSYKKLEKVAELLRNFIKGEVLNAKQIR